MLTLAVPPIHSHTPQTVSDATGRTTKQCRERYSNVLDPTILRTPWTGAELLKLFAAQDELGNKWSLIASRLPGRPETAVKNTYYAAIRREKRRMYAQEHGLPIPPPFHDCLSRVENLAERAAATTAAATNTGHEVKAVKVVDGASGAAAARGASTRKRRAPGGSSSAAAPSSSSSDAASAASKLCQSSRPRARKHCRTRAPAPSVDDAGASAGAGSSDNDLSIHPPTAAAMASFTLYDPVTVPGVAELHSKVARIQETLYGKVATGAFARRVVSPAAAAEHLGDFLRDVLDSDASIDADRNAHCDDDPALWFSEDSASTVTDGDALSCLSSPDSQCSVLDGALPPPMALPAPAAMPKAGSPEAVAAAAAALAAAEKLVANALGRATPRPVAGDALSSLGLDVAFGSLPPLLGPGVSAGAGAGLTDFHGDDAASASSADLDDAFDWFLSDDVASVLA